MKDGFKREITYLRLSVTDRCNLRCRYCMPAEGVCLRPHADFLSEEEMVRAVEVASELGIRKVRLTGGEPLVKKNILSIAKRIASVPGIRDVSMTTNGILLPELGKDLLAAGVKRVNISLDTLDPAKYAAITRIGRFENAWKGIESAIETGFEKIKLNCVLIGGFNDGEIRDFAELTLRYPIDVRFIELMPMGTGEFGSGAYLPVDAVRKALPEAEESTVDGVARRLKLPGALGYVGIISPLSDLFCDRCNRMRLTADGKLKPCLHFGTEFPIRGLSREEVKARFIQAIEAKPARHGALSCAEMSRAGRTMNAIGG